MVVVGRVGLFVVVGRLVVVVDFVVVVLLMVVVVVVGGGGGALQYFKFNCCLSLSVKTLPPRRRDGSAFHSIVLPFPLLKAPLKEKERLLKLFGSFIIK